MNLCRSLLLASLVSMTFVLPTQAQTPKPKPATATGRLQVGDQAPAIKVGEWVKGDEVKAFDADRVYIVEFWATWCGPCKRSIPHLTELQSAHKDDVTVIGVSVWEKPPQGQTASQIVKRFVDAQGAKMDYTVAADDTDGSMARTWMQAAGRNGIPSAFIVDQRGKIAWIGNPLQGIDPALEKVLASAPPPLEKEPPAKDDSKPEPTSKPDPRAAQFEKAMQLDQAGRTAEAVAIVDSMIASQTDPDELAPLQRYKFDLLVKSDETKAAEFARSLTGGALKDSAFDLVQMSNSVSRLDKAGKAVRDAAVTMATRAVELEADNPGAHDSLGMAQFRAGRAKEALASEERALSLLKSMGETADAELLKQVTLRIEQFKTPAKPGR